MCKNKCFSCTALTNQIAVYAWTVVQTEVYSVQLCNILETVISVYSFLRNTTKYTCILNGHALGKKFTQVHCTRIN